MSASVETCRSVSGSTCRSVTDENVVSGGGEGANVVAPVYAPFVIVVGDGVAEGLGDLGEVGEHGGAAGAVEDAVDVCAEEVIEAGGEEGFGGGDAFDVGLVAVVVIDDAPRAPAGAAAFKVML